MARRIPQSVTEEIEYIVGSGPEGLTAVEIEQRLGVGGSRRTLQYRLKHLVAVGRLVMNGKGRSARYRAREVGPEEGGDGGHDGIDRREVTIVPLSKRSVRIRRYLGATAEGRRPVGHVREFLESYLPNESFYLAAADRSRLRMAGRSGAGGQPAGTYTKRILERLLIDLSWNSSRLEGNTYSLLDTRRLIAFGREADGKDSLETQMILNHKDAIEFLVESTAEIGFDRYTILNLHALLANNLLPDPMATGRLRTIAVGIERSPYHPPEVPQLIEEHFDRFLATASAIDDPFEQAFFTMVHLPYLQPFDDVNKRVSRLAANIPFIRGNVCPLSFTDVPRELYNEAVLGVYELNQVDLLRDVFVWAYERSVQRYKAVRQSLGEPDPFRLRHRDAMREIVAEVVRGRMDRAVAAAHVERRARESIDRAEEDRFREIVEDELLGLHEGNFARYRIRPSELEAWLGAWSVVRTQGRR